MNLVVDIGNTFTKLGFFDHDELVHTEILEDQSLWSKYKQEADHILISSVRGEVFEQEKHVMYLNAQTSVPVNIKYKTPQTLGADRLAGVIGAKVLYPNENCLLIDCGTCITFDFIDAENNYYGGSISPGLEMKFKALSNFTAALPLVQKKSEAALIGDTTENSILSGVINGTVAEIEQMIRNYSHKYEPLKVILTGGDSNFFESKLKAPIFVQPKILLIGLNRILKYNVENA